MGEGKKLQSRLVSSLIDQSMAHPWSKKQVEEALEDPIVRFRLDWSGKPMASPLIGLVLGRRVADLLEIDLVCVDPAHRRAGIARDLLEGLIAAEAEAGGREVQLELAASNEAARALYERLRFVVVGRRARYYPDGADALLLSREIG